MLVGLRERTPSQSCFGRDVELLMLGAQNFLESAAPLAWDES